MPSRMTSLYNFKIEFIIFVLNLIWYGGFRRDMKYEICIITYFTLTGIFFMVQILLLNLRKYFGAIKLSELLLSIALSFIPLGADKLNCTLI